MGAEVTLLTDEWHKLSSEAKFCRYTDVLGLPRQSDERKFIRRLNREFPEEWRTFQDIVRQRAEGDLDDNFYELKNQNLEFSLLVTAFERTELHNKAFSSLESISDPVSNILDIGCENGFLTCLLALRWPNAQVVGLDLCGPAIDLARELALKLNLKNVTFLVGAGEDISKTFKGKSFDLITTITMLHDGGVFPSMEELHRRNGEAFDTIRMLRLPIFSAIASVLGSSNARWVSMERCQNAALFSAWCQAIDFAGLGIDFDKSGRIACEGDLLTIVAAGRNFPKPIDMKKVHGLWIASDFDRWTAPSEPPWVIRDQQAEVLFRQLNAKTCLDRLVVSDGSGQEIERIEVWDAGVLCLYYHSICCFMRRATLWVKSFGTRPCVVRIHS